MNLTDTSGLDRAWSKLAFLQSQLDLIDPRKLPSHDADQFHRISHQTGAFALLVIELGAHNTDLSGHKGAEDILLLIETHCNEAGTAVEYWLQRAEGSLRTKIRIQ